MDADPALCKTLYESYTLNQLLDKRRECTDALLSPETITSQSIDAVSDSFAPRTHEELEQTISNINCAIYRHRNQGKAPVRTGSPRAFHFNRPCR
jgi:hypothetical protein